jgi:hypothetical protein
MIRFCSKYFQLVQWSKDEEEFAEAIALEQKRNFTYPLGLKLDPEKMKTPLSIQLNVQKP